MFTPSAHAEQNKCCKKKRNVYNKSAIALMAVLVPVKAHTIVSRGGDAVVGARRLGSCLAFFAAIFNAKRF